MGVGKALIAHTRSVAAEWGIVPFCCAGIPIIIQKQDLWQQSNSISVPPKTNILQLSMCALYGPDALAGVTGQYYEDEIYNINIAEAEEFDRSFPKKERITGTPTQKRFEEVVAMQKEYMQPSGK